MPVKEMGELDKWILSHAGTVFDEVANYFREYEFSKGFALLNHFITVELSGIYLDISKDRLYCNAKNDPIRLSAQSAMALIAQKMMALIAPTLTYTIDEMMEYAPKIITGEAKNVFDLLYTPLPEIKIPRFDESHMIRLREEFFERVDSLKKDKEIKSTLELALVIVSDKLENELMLTGIDLEDWFTTSHVSVVKSDASYQNMANSLGKDLGFIPFNSEEMIFIRKIDKHKCPRCWKYRAKSEEELCERCAKALNV